MNFERREDKRGFRYYKPEDEDEWYPSVTTVKNIITNKGLQDWFRRASAEEIKKKTQHGCDVGDIVHDSIEELLKTGSTSIDNVEDDKKRKDASKYLNGFVNFYENHHPEYKELEVSVLNSQFGIAGTIDMVGSIEYKGERVSCICDWKTSNSKNMVAWTHQLTSYGLSDPFQENGVNPDLFIVHLKKHTKKGYQLRPIEYDKTLTKSIMNIWNRKYDDGPKFADEPETDFTLEGDEGE